MRACIEVRSVVECKSDNVATCNADFSKYYFDTQ